MLIGTISAAFATKFSFPANLLFCLALFFFGLISGPWIRATFGAGSATGAILGAIIPNWQLFWMSSALSSGKHIPFSYLLVITGYAVLYSMICLLWAAA